MQDANMQFERSAGHSPDCFHRIERASRDELSAVQYARLRATLDLAYYKVPAFRKKFDVAGCQPGDIQSLDDLGALPFTFKDDLRQAYPFGLFAVTRESLLRLHASSGTTGKPTVVGYTRDDLDIWSELMARSLYAGGARPGQMLHNAYGYGLFTGGLGFHDGAERLGMTCLPVSGGMTERQVQLIADLRPAVIGCTPSYMLAIADEFERQGLDARTCGLRLGIHGAEPWTEAMRSEIESRMGVSAVNIYGLSEIMGPGVGAECIETKDGLTLWEDHFYPEIIDPDTGAVLPDGETGELVLTTLTKQASPMVRYRTRDITRLLPPTARNMRRIDRIMGRTDDMLIIRGVNVFPSQIEARILANQALAPHYVLEITKDGPLDAMTVVAEAREPFADADHRMAAARSLEMDIKARVGLSVQVEVGEPGRVVRSAGKAQRVIDLRDG